MTGTIRRLMTTGYGFITPDHAPGESVFFGHRALRHGVSFDADLRPGQRVDYDLGIDPRSQREQAVAVRLLDAAIAPSSSR
jgi:cold shock CspA family protein